jgi:hypothetical protein
MHVTQLLRSILGDIQLNQAKRLELKAGQLVSGTVLRLLNEQEALVNIQGIVLRAEMAASLKPGQTALLQVQPESTPQQIVLRPVETSRVPVAEESVSQMLRSFGIPDDPPHRQLVQQMLAMEVPLTKENIAKFSAALAAKPAQAAADEWIRAAFVAFQRNLPLSGQTIQALHQVLNGPPLHQSMQRLAEQIDHWLRSQPAERPAPMLVRLRQGLAEALELSARVSGQAGQNAGQPAVADAPEVSSVRVINEVASPPPAAPTPGGRMARTEGAGGNSMAEISANDQGIAKDGMKSGDGRQSDTELTLPRRQTPGVSVQQHSGKEEGQNSVNQEGQRTAVKSEAAEPVTPSRAEAAGVNTAGQGEEKGNSSWIVRLLKALGVDHEQQVVKLLEKPESGQRGPRHVLPDVSGHSSSQQTAAAENLKSLLIQLQTAEDLPAAVKEPSQQLLQQLTGQQLLLANDRSSLFTHVTLFLPIVNEQGEQTAGIHIHSKKGRGGELDAENCRLVFVLQMKTLGDTIIDVTVTNKIVSLQIHNDHPQFAALLEQGREEIAERLGGIGYTFSSLKFVPLAKTQSSLKFAAAANPAASWLYKNKAYKGVDLRV